MLTMKLTDTIKTRKKKNSPYKQNWGELIKMKRQALHENQTQFGKRFGVSYVAVSLWESGKRDVPGDVTWWLTHEQETGK